MSGPLAALLIHSVGSDDAHLRALSSFCSSSGRNTSVMYVCVRGVGGECREHILEGD